MNKENDNDTLSRIKMVSLELFNKKGYAATTTREIATEVGIKSSTLYFYFKSKEDIFFTLHKEARELVYEKAHATLKHVKDESVEKQLYTFFCLLMELFTEYNLYYRFIFRYLAHPVYGIQDKIQEEFQQWLGVATEYIYKLFYQGKIEGVFKDISIEQLIKSFYRYQNGYIHDLIIDNKLPTKEENDYVWQILWDGIKA